MGKTLTKPQAVPAVRVEEKEKDKYTTLRVEPDVSLALSVVAFLQGRSVTEVTKEAIEEYVERQKSVLGAEQVARTIEVQKKRKEGGRTA